ncbi:MAG TPA: alcohol dehydrogenase catalytic domain-containing protein, partial [Propionicimonas sp.]
MRAAVWTAPDEVGTRDVPMPEVPPGWALVKVAYNGICGTDLSILHGKHPRAQAPLIMGHEMSGWVEQAGATGPVQGA